MGVDLEQRWFHIMVGKGFFFSHVSSCWCIMLLMQDGQNTESICIRHTSPWNLGGGILSARSCQNLLNKERQEDGLGRRQTLDFLQRQHT